MINSEQTSNYYFTIVFFIYSLQNKISHGVHSSSFSFEAFGFQEPRDIFYVKIHVGLQEEKEKIYLMKADHCFSHAANLL